MSTKNVLVFDPGESTGWVCGTITLMPDDKYHLVGMIGGTHPMSHEEIANCIGSINPDVIVYETFNLYPGKAQSLSWNSFYPCEVIGVIKYMAQMGQIETVGQSPGTKKFSGGLDDFWKKWAVKHDITEHTKDAYFHLKYYIHQLNAKHKKKRV